MALDDSGKELEAFCIGRAETYRLFAALIDREVDLEGARHLAQLEEGMDAGAKVEFGEEGDDATGPSDQESTLEGERMVADGFARMVRSITSFDVDDQNDLACEYARIFLAAGTYEGQAAVPYESIYTSEERLLMQDARDQVRALFRAAGVMPSAGGSIPDDYVVFELEFMALLNERIVEASEAGDAEGTVRLARQARSFFTEHIANWVNQLLADVDGVARLPFYHGFAQALRGFLICEERDTQDVLRYLDAARVA